ncbi:MAG: DNA-formamidopyrimidine glycosylase [SAR86 cluster bacterium]|uniref:Formamidopyrimidine-DNA glycosylase n=1 Tax=SAR86 cluster bacterium TaxID=2030880 RepID=A0A2A4MSA2_9GAMM|nr:MAG: DNA-formamidopyrimidine glycosylase [SAR86 cluster bacterium]
MPELPEVETTRAGISPHIRNAKINAVIVRQHKLRWPVSPQLHQLLPGNHIVNVRRRGKYLLLELHKGTVLIHLGMSGSLRIVDSSAVVGKHDHVDIVFANSKILRYTDPRRFGCILWDDQNIELHPLLVKLGPEPLTEDFHASYLFKQSRTRKVPVKTFIMNANIVVGVGNIYANEALFMAGIHPSRAAGNISLKRYLKLVTCIKWVLQQAIEAGGTTLKDFTNSDGKPGYFKQSLQVYGRSGLACVGCGQSLKEIRIGQRSTVFCTNCQH